MPHALDEVVIEISDLNNRWNKMALNESAKKNQPLSWAQDKGEAGQDLGTSRRDASRDSALPRR